ncbi:MFS transporter [Brevibacillus fluminis]|uniref:MFS transporter n=1 Tax=Brevibacillus fluminis TaxID=511487 RepID=A0A3M8DXJ9_9BACL|nr:MFS transporter [Brevibacillus fluminis]RNB92265.1 MFS transporter [Brevibacillus fluminis]
MEVWKRNLYVLCVAVFVVMMAMSMIMPFLPLYIHQDFGIEDENKVTLWAGIIFGSNFLTAGIVSPIWGRLADRYGRKIMVLRSGFFMAITVALTGFAQTMWQLLALRLLNGTMSGFIPSCTALVASSVPRENSGWALGILQSSAVAGSIMGPLIGGILADRIGFRMIFVFTGALLLLATLLVLVTVKEQFVPPAKQEKTSFREDTRQIFSLKMMPAIFGVTVMIQFALFSIVPVLPLYIQSLLESPENVAFYAGIVASAMGIANVLSAPQLGKLGDRFGPNKVLLICLAIAAVLFIPQAMVTSIWQLVALRFLLGLCLGGLLPSVNSLLRRITPTHMVSRVYGFNNSFVCLGNLFGPITGGFIASTIGLRSVFYVTSGLLFLNAIWVAVSLYRAPLAKEGKEL